MTLLKDWASASSLKDMPRGVFPTQQPGLPRRNASATLGYDKFKVVIFLCYVSGSESEAARRKLPKQARVGEKIDIGDAEVLDLRVCRGERGAGHVIHFAPLKTIFYLTRTLLRFGNQGLHTSSMTRMSQHDIAGKPAVGS